MKKLVLLPLMALFVVAGCQDLKPNQAAEAKVDIAAPSFSVSEENTSTIERSTVCIAFDEHLARAKADLAATPGDAETAERVTRLEDIVANCDGATGNE